MLHLAIIGIVCAVSAPIEGTAIIGRKNYGSDAFGHFDEGIRKEAKSFSPRVYNVDAHNSSAFDKQKITDRTNSFNCDYINNKQYQSDRSSLCSVVENVFRKNKNESIQSDVRSSFRKRGLLWSTNKFSPKTLRPPMDAECECGNCTPCDWNNEKCHCGKPKCPKCKCRKPCCRKKKIKYPPYSLNRCQKKEFLRLKKPRGKMYKRHLDKVKIDDELDLNKRIQKLVQEIAAENQRTALTESTDECSKPDASSGEKTSEKNNTSFRFLKKLKKFFWFNKNNCYKKKNNYDNPNSVPVNSVRGDVLVADKTARISNLKTPFLKRETRFRRNLYKNYVSYSQGDNSVPRFRNKIMVKKPYSYSNNFKKKAKFLYPQYRQRLFGDIRKPHRLLYNPRVKSKLRPHSKLILKANVKDIRSKRQNDKFEQLLTKDEATTEDSDTVQNGENVEYKGAELTTMKSDHLEGPTDDSVGQENLEKSNDEDGIPDHTLEKPLLDKGLRYSSANEGDANADFKTFQDRYNLRTDFPLFDNRITGHLYQKDKYGLSTEEYLNPYRYLKIRHALRHYLIHNNILNPKPSEPSVERMKRCGGGKCCPLPHKCWRSPPLLCIPYIRKGQDDLLRYLIRTMQRMIGRPFPPKIDIFDNTKFKPCGKMAGSTCEDVMYDDDDECDCVSTQPCMPVPICPTCPPPPPSTPSSCPCQVDPGSKVCPCPPQLVPMPKPYLKSPYAPNNRPCPPTQRSCPYENYNSPYGNPPVANVYPSSSAYPYSNDNINPMLYFAPNYGYNEPVPTPQSPCLPGNPYGRSAVTSESLPLRQLSGPREATYYAPNPPCNPLQRASERTPLAFTRAQYSPPSTANACSWYMSKSPIERAEYFAYTNLPYNGPPESVSAPTPWAQSELSKPGVVPPPYQRSNAQLNQPAPQKFDLQTGPAYLERPPMPMAPGMNSQSNTERFMYGNQYKERRKGFEEMKQSDDANSEQMNQMRKETHGRTDSDPGDNLNPQDTVRCEAQQHPLNENQMQKPEISPEYSKSGSKGSIHNTYKYTDQQTVLDSQQMPKAEANNDYSKPLVKEQNSQMVQNSHLGLPADTNDGTSKNQNIEDSYKCGNQHCPLNEQQIPKPEMNVKEVKSPNKEEVFRCPDRQCTLNDHQQLQKPEVNENNDDRRFFKAKHYKGLLKSFRKPATEFHSYDDYYDKQPNMDLEELSGFRYGKSPFMKAWRGYSRKVKKNSKRGSSVRQKRGDNYYAGPDSFEDYNDYESDFDVPVVSDEAPSYEMFSELAKAVKAFNSTESDDSTDTSTSPPEGTKTPPLKGTPIKFGNVTMIKTPNDSANIPSATLNTIMSIVNKPGEYSIKRNYSTAAVNIIAAQTKSADATTAIVLESTTPENDCEKSNNTDCTDSKKSGLFQTSPKSLGIQSNSGFLTTTKASNMGSAREDKELDGNQDLDSAEEGQVPTTLRTAAIVKGPKKLLTKPSPKVYTKVYPDSILLEPESNEAMAMATAAVTTTKTVLEKTTLTMGSTSDIQVQLLAVCEGYLEVVKLIKAQNQTLGDDLDANLARYCEDIISQSFNLQSDSSKPKKQESTQLTSEKNTTAAAVATIPNSTESEATLLSKDEKTRKQEVSQHRNKKIIVNIPNTVKYKRGTFYNPKRDEEDLRMKKLKCSEYEDLNDDEAGVSDRKKKSQLRRKKSEKTKTVCLSTQSDLKSVQKKPKRYRRKEQSEEELMKKGITKEQLELLHLLRKRKRVLLSWLYNSKEAPNKANNAQETEYFNDEELAQGSDLPSHSGTITPTVYEVTSTTPKSEGSFLNESVFPVYAKEYGYDRGGELMEVEVLWRKINEKTHEKKIFKNLSVLALLLPSTNEPNINAEGTHLIPRALESEEMSGIQSKSESKVGYADQTGNCNKKTSTDPTVANKVNPTVAKVNKSCPMNNTYMYISRPDPRSIVGAPPNLTAFHSNSSHKISHKFNAAKDLFQEYTLEFLNYAVYILPIMFTILFVFCCLCCAVQIFKTKKSGKKYKKKKKRQISTEDSDTSEESERESKKKRREARRKKHEKDSAEDLDKKRSNAFWNVLKMNSTKANPEFNDESQTEKKRSFLRFLKGRRDEAKAGMCSSRYSPVREVEEDDVQQCHNSGKRKDGNPKKCCQSEAEERRELIALLEELKKIETENSGEKKEVKSVHVQYMTQEDDSPVFQRPDFAFPYQKNVFGMPKGCSPCNKHFPFYQSDPATVRNYELFEDVNELTELLPCECNYYSKRNDYLRHCDFNIKQEGGCKGFIKIFRDAGVTRNKPFREKNLFNNESENRSFIFNKYRSISTDTSDELLGVTHKSAGTEVRLTDNAFKTASPFKLQSKKNTDFVEEMDSLKREIKNKKHVRLKDDGVLCRL